MTDNIIPYIGLMLRAADEASEESNYTDAQILNEAELLDSLKAD